MPQYTEVSSAPLVEVAHGIKKTGARGSGFVIGTRDLIRDEVDLGQSAVLNNHQLRCRGEEHLKFPEFR